MNYGNGKRAEKLAGDFISIRWCLPPVFVVVVVNNNMITTTLPVWISEGPGRFTINNRQIHEYFGRPAYRDKLVEPFVVTHTIGNFDVWCTVRGGGETGEV